MSLEVQMESRGGNRYGITFVVGGMSRVLEAADPREARAALAHFPEIAGRHFGHEYRGQASRAVNESLKALPPCAAYGQVSARMAGRLTGLFRRS